MEMVPVALITAGRCLLEALERQHDPDEKGTTNESGEAEISLKPGEKPSRSATVCVNYPSAADPQCYNAQDTTQRVVASSGGIAEITGIRPVCAHSWLTDGPSGH
jgi:hypothetical protein